MGQAGSLYLSIGEPMNTELSEGDILISQGFLQVSIAETTDIDDLLEESINVFPNPTTAVLTLELPEMSGSYQYQLFNSMGAEIEMRELELIRTEVDLSSLSSGTYFIKVIKGSEHSKTLKIVKL